MAEPTTPLAEWTGRRTLVATLVVAGVCLAFFLVYYLRLVAFLLFVGIVLATLLRPAINLVSRLGLGHGTSVALVYTILALALLVVVIAGLPLVVDQMTAMVDELPKYYQSFRQQLFRLPSELLRRMASSLPETILDEPDEEAAATPEETAEQRALVEAVSRATSFGRPVVRGLLSAMAALLLAFYWSLHEERIVRSFLLLARTDRRESARELVDTLQAKVGGYLRGQGILCLVVGSLNFLAFLVIGLPNAATLGLIAGICEAIPMFGPTLGALPALAVALSVDPGKVVWVIAAAAGVQMIENYLLVPRVMDKSVGVSPVVTLLAIAGFGSLMGFAGVVLAIPLAAILQVFLDRYVFSAQALEPAPPAGRDAASLVRYQARELIHDLRMLIRRHESESSEHSDHIEEEIEAIALELEKRLPVDEAEAAGAAATAEAGAEP